MQILNLFFSVTHYQWTRVLTYLDISTVHGHSNKKAIFFYLRQNILKYVLITTNKAELQHQVVSLFPWVLLVNLSSLDSLSTLICG